MRTGSNWYIGVPGSGKTTLAKAHALAESRRNGCPVLVLNSEGVAQFEGFPTTRSRRAAIRAVWGSRASCALIPAGAADVRAVIAAAHNPGRINLLIDETSAWLSARSGASAELLALMRAHRHAGLNLYLTTQHLTGDVPQAAFSCAPHVYIFRCTAPAVLERIERTWGIEPGRVRKLRQFQYLHVYEGFSTVSA